MVIKQSQPFTQYPGCCQHSEGLVQWRNHLEVIFSYKTGPLKQTKYSGSCNFKSKIEKRKILKKKHAAMIFLPDFQPFSHPRNLSNDSLITRSMLSGGKNFLSTNHSIFGNMFLSVSYLFKIFCFLTLLQFFFTIKSQYRCLVHVFIFNNNNKKRHCQENRPFLSGRKDPSLKNWGKFQILSRCLVQSTH